MEKRKTMETKITRSIMLVTAVLLLAVLVGCIQPPNPSQKNVTPQPQNVTPSPNVTCQDKDCFILAANNCEAMNLTLTDEVGTFTYSTSEYCTLRKTLVSLNSNETQAMKNLLEGKNMTCRYEKGKFDQKLVTSLLGGMEYCRGDLKDNLGELLIFS